MGKRAEPDRTQAGGRSTTLPGAVEFGIGSQDAETISNVGRDQFNQVIQRRESFLREVAASRTRARLLIVWGFVLFIAGAATYGWAILSFAGDEFFNSDFGDGSFAESDMPRLFGPEVGGVPIGLVGFAVAFVGVVMLLVGIVLHVVATSRQRRLDQELMYPFLPPTWPTR